MNRAAFLTGLYNHLNGIAFTCKLSVPTKTLLSDAAVLTVTEDKAAPGVAGVGGQSGSQTVVVLFDEFVDATTANNPANYIPLPSRSFRNTRGRCRGRGQHQRQCVMQPRDGNRVAVWVVTGHARRMAQTVQPKAGGLPMASKWDPEKLRGEEEFLQGLESKPLLERVRGYAKLTGPAWMQSAMTLGAGSAVASVVAGASFGYQLLWVQPVAMFLGIIMMGALGNVVLSTGERPYGAVAREIHPAVAFLWALGSIVASVIWHFPQYGLAGAGVWDLAMLAGAPADSAAAQYAVKFAGGAGILAMAIVVTWNYGSGTRGIKIYETFLRWVIRLVILAFLFVVIKTGVNWGALFDGFFGFKVPPGDNTMTLILGAIGASVGINMTFLYGYSMLAKGWGKHHKGLSRYDLFSSMFVPFVLVTSLIIIAMANTVYDPVAGVLRTDLKPVDASRSLETLLGSSLGRIILDLGFIGMACGAISTHMVVCGFTGCEMFKLDYTPKRYRMFTLLPAIGILGVAFPSPLWMPIAASAIALTMLPIAYLTFFVMNNKKSYIGEAAGHGWRRAAFNLAMIVAILFATVASAIKIKKSVVDPIRQRLEKKAASWQVPAGQRPQREARCWE